jgi:hypothetical protein
LTSASSSDRDGCDLASEICDSRREARVCTPREDPLEAASREIGRSDAVLCNGLRLLEELLNHRTQAQRLLIRGHCSSP